MSRCLEPLALPEFAAVADVEALESPPKKLGNFKAAIKPESDSFLSSTDSVEINNATISKPSQSDNTEYTHNTH